ncbi:MAG: hypothetical protein P8L77_03655 [Gammaproteobacteria bacterium]|nr:hypothetical protein [Gammaproteobacteria bacterium]
MLDFLTDKTSDHRKLYHRLFNVIPDIDKKNDPLNGINDFILTKKSPEELKKKVDDIFTDYTFEQKKVILDILSPFYKDLTEVQTIELTNELKDTIRKKLYKFSKLHEYLTQLNDDESSKSSVKTHMNNPYQYIALTQYLKSIVSDREGFKIHATNLTSVGKTLVREIADLLFKDTNSRNCIGKLSKSEFKLLVEHFYHLHENFSTDLKEASGIRSPVSDLSMREKLQYYVNRNLEYILVTFSNITPESLNKLDTEIFNKSCLFNTIIYDKLQFLMPTDGMYFVNNKKHHHIYRNFTLSNFKPSSQNAALKPIKEVSADNLPSATVVKTTLDKIWEQYNSTYMPSIALQTYEKLNDELKTLKQSYIELFNLNHNNDFLLSMTYAAIGTLLVTAMLLNLIPSTTVIGVFYVIAAMSFENGLPYKYSSSTENDGLFGLKNLASDIFNFLKFCVTDLFYLIPDLIVQYTPSFMPPIQANDEKNKLRIYRILNYSYVIASLTAIILFPQAQLLAFLFVTNFYGIASYYIHKSVYGTDSAYLTHKAFNALEEPMNKTNDNSAQPTPSLMSSAQPQTQDQELKKSTKHSKENPSITLSSLFHINNNDMLAFNENAQPANAA